jgi:hypothetical protein
MYKYILYTGIGSNDFGLRSKEEFLDIMQNASNHYCEMTFSGFDKEPTGIFCQRWRGTEWGSRYEIPYSNLDNIYLADKPENLYSRFL